MSMLPSLPSLVDLVLLVAVAELLLLMLWPRLRIARGPLLANLLAGLWLMLALRLALADAAALWVVACLLAAGLAHLFDLRARWSSAPRMPACREIDMNPRPPSDRRRRPLPRRTRLERNC